MFCGARSRIPAASAVLQGSNSAVESCDMGCEICGYNWYEQHKHGDEWWNRHCDCCLGTDAQQAACKKMCVRQWPVVLYDGLNYTGRAVGIDTEGVYDFCKKTLATNDSIQSVKVAPGWKVTLIKHCAGETPNPELVLLESKRDLEVMNKQTSVVKVEKVLPRYFLVTADTCPDAPPGACSVNWVDAKGNILFHFNPRLGQNAVVMNTHTNGSWGPEERIPCDKNGFSSSQSVFIWIVVTPVGFEVRNANGALLHMYKHRLPWTSYLKFVTDKLRCEESKGQKCFGFGNYSNNQAIVEAPLEVNIRQMNYTVSGWAKPSSYKYGILFSKDRSGVPANQLRFEIHPQGNVAYATHGVPNGAGFAAPSHDPNNWGWALTSPAPLPIGVWTHVAAVRQGKSMRLYINGVKVAETTAADVYDHNSQHKMRVGSRYAPGTGSAGGDFFPGHLMGWKYWWDRAMSDVEIQNEARLPAGPVVLFDGLGYTGAAKAIDKPGTYDFCKGTLAKNDTIQSVYVAPGWKATLIKHCAGEIPNPSVVLVASSPNLGAMNKQTSIVKVEAAGFVPPSDCSKKSYGRGAGHALHTCANGHERNGALCYPLCKPGFHGAGPVCWQNCAGGFRDDGAYCAKPGAYGRGAGYPIWDQKKCERQNSQGCEKWGAIWYPKCRPGFSPKGCCICSPNCPNGQRDIGVSCAKQSYGRGAGVPMGCGSQEDLNGALCYPKCENGWSGVGPVCWQQCPAGLKDCGAYCAKNCLAAALQGKCS